MSPIDLRTIFFSHVLVSIVNLVLIGTLYLQIRKRFQGSRFILISFILSTTGTILIFSRSSIPDWLSISFANTIIATSTVLLLIGFERFVDKKGSQIQNYVLIIIFFIVNIYFTYVKSDLIARGIDFSLVYVALSFQIAFLMLVRVPESMRKITRPVGLVFSAVFILQLLRVFFLWNDNSHVTEYFDLENSESFFLLTWEIITIFLAFSIFLMYNKRLIVEVNLQEEKFSKAFHAVPLIIAISKLEDGEIFEVNKSVETIYGYKTSELIHAKTTDLHLWNQQTDRQKFISDLKLKGSVFKNEYMFRKKSGEPFTGLISASVIEINNEQCVLSVIDDITERKMAEVNLLKSEASLKEINSTKDKFFSIIAHDLKSPFTGILGFSNILIDQIKNKNYDEIDKYAEVINKSAQSAFDLLMNLMEWSRFQTGRMEFSPEYIEVVKLIKSVTALLTISADNKSISISLKLPKKLIIYADQLMIETVWRNLISNAIKFTPEKGNILISVEEKELEFQFLVSDNGVGIEKSNQEKLFRIDQDFSLPGTEDETGTGLGLILCSEFIEKHQGSIWVESEIGLGSRFYFSLPKK